MDRTLQCDHSLKYYGAGLYSGPACFVVLSILNLAQSGVKGLLDLVRILQHYTNRLNNTVNGFDINLSRAIMIVLFKLLVNRRVK